MSETKLISTSALAKSKGLTSKELRDFFLSSELLIQEGEQWVLTQKGLKLGGAYKDSKQYGRYIVWPENIEVTLSLITSSLIGKHFELSANKINYVFSELGWIEKGIKGWVITKQGRQNGGVQSEDYKSGIPYVRWPQTIQDNKSLKETVSHLKGEDLAQKKPEEYSVEFRQKFEAKHRTTDGHYVRSKAEMLIDNWLYMAEIVHAYERKLPIEEDVYSDFYIPTGKVYIEYWGLENDPKYRDRKQKKIDIYKKYGFNLIELNEVEVQNLDDYLPRLLLKYGVQAY